MSLINQVLRDLVERKAVLNADEIDLYDFKNVPLSSPNPFKKAFTILGCVFCIFTLNYYYKIHADIYYANVTAPIRIELPKNTNVTTKFVIPNDSTSLPSILAGVSLRIENDMTYLDLSLNRSAFYRIMTDAKQKKIILFLENTKLIAGLPPVSYENSAIKNIQIMNAKNNYLAIILELKDGVEVKQFSSNDNEKLPEMQLGLFYKNEIPPMLITSETMQSQSESTAPLIIESQADDQEKNITANATVDELYQRAVDLVDSGQQVAAVNLLKNILLQASEFAPARELLSVLLIKEGRKKEATAIINKGLQQKPLYPGYLQLKAYLLVGQGRVLSALNLLKSANPPLEANWKYYAFVAALHQRLGQYASAQHIYEQLVILQPDNSNFWAALGIALANQGKREQAIEAYSKAEETGNISPQIKRYLESLE